MNEQELLQFVRAKEDEIRAQRFESAFFWDWQGNLLLSKDGEPTSVQFTDEEIALVQGAISMHNHPYGWNFSARDPRRAGYSFSEFDVQSACQASLAILRIVTPQFRYMMKPPPQGWGLDYWENVLQLEYQQTYKKLFEKWR